jgi:hypothetical protein
MSLFVNESKLRVLIKREFGLGWPPKAFSAKVEKIIEECKKIP